MCVLVEYSLNTGFERGGAVMVKSAVLYPFPLDKTKLLILEGSKGRRAIL